MRLLHAARLSRLGDASTGIDKQDEASKTYAAAYEHHIVATAADVDVSGSKAPQERPKLGPWLTNAVLMCQYDGIIAATMDRLGRDARDLHELRNWAEDNGKKIIVISPPLQWPPEKDDLASGIIWDVLARLAEYELKVIKKRSFDSQAFLITGGYLVGTVPYGFRVIPKDNHTTLEPDPDLVPVLEGMISRAIEGQSLTKISEWLDTVTPSKGGGMWHPKTVRHILRNEALIGRRHQSVEEEATGRTVKGVLKFEGVIDVATWKGLQAALDGRSFKKGAPAEAPSMLTGSLFCPKCGRVMHRKLRTVTRKRDNSSYVIATYRCSGTAREPSTCKNMVSMPDLHAFVDEWFTNRPLAETPVVETVLTPGNGYADELEQNARDVAELDIDSDDYMEKLAVLRQERKRLQGLPAEPDRIEQRPIGVVRDRWLALDESERRKLLMDSGIRIEAVRVERNVRNGDSRTGQEPALRKTELLRDYLGAFSDVQDGIQVTVYFPAELSAKVTGSIVMTRPTVAV